MGVVGVRFGPHDPYRDHIAPDVMYNCSYMQVWCLGKVASDSGPVVPGKLCLCDRAAVVRVFESLPSLGSGQLRVVFDVGIQQIRHGEAS